MKAPLHLHAGLLAMALCAAPLAAGAQSTTPQPDRKAAERKASVDARKAHQACERIDDAQRKQDCLRKARAEHAQARRKAKADSQAGLPAVQTESARVGTSGAAPVAVDQRTPGRPASAAR